jgi:type 2A phosphatase activator TIP41
MASLSAKLEGDAMQSTCQREVEDLHRLFVAWFQGESTADNLTADLQRRLSTQFSHVAPNGQFLQGRDVLIGHLQDKYGCYKNRVFKIDIYNVQLLWHDGGNQALCTYEEWQSWQPEEAAPGDDGEPEVHQFGRLSTCLLHKKDGRFQWIHVHETWLEDEEPQHTKPTDEQETDKGLAAVLGNNSNGQLDNETVMTGPVEYNKVPPPEQPLARALGGNSDSESEEEDPAADFEKVEAEDNDEDGDEEDDEADTSLTGMDRQTSEVSEAEQYVLHLYSDRALSPDQLDHQEQARQAMDEEGIPYFELDGSEPDQIDKRNELFKLSGKWGRYPQFFLVDSEGNTVFWGLWKDFANSQKQGKLTEDLTQDLQVLAAQRSVPAEEAAQKVAPPEAAPAPPPAPEPAPAPVSPTPPVPAPSVTSSYKPPALLLLLSSQVLSPDHKERQQKVLSTLDRMNLKYMQVDGSLAEKREQRNELFKLSKVWGLYPQIFLVDTDTKDISYWGGWDQFSEASDAGTLAAELGVKSAVVDTKNDDEDEDDQDDGSDSESEDDESESEDAPHEAAVEVKEVESRSMPAPAPAAAATKSADKGATLLDKIAASESVIVLLISNHSLSNEQMSRQENCRTILNEAKLSYEEIDGSDRESRDARNELFKVSKLWGRYPQIFVSLPSGENIFWGEWEKLNECKNSDTLLKEFALTMGIDDNSPSTQDETEEDDEAEETPEPEEDEEEEEGNPLDGIPIKPSEDKIFMDKAAGILDFETDDEDDVPEPKKEEEVPDEEKLNEMKAVASPIPQDASLKRHVSPQILKYAKPLTWENTLVGISISGFDIGTSQGPMADESWYKEVGNGLESISQCKSAPRPRRQISLPEMIFPTAHVALEGHGVWMSWDALDAMEEWARAHQQIPVNSGSENKGVSVLKAKDAKLWESKYKSMSSANSNVPSVFHYDWTFSSPFCGKIEGGSWVELDESGMRTQLLTDKTSPILFFDEIILFEDDLHDNGQAEMSVKLRVMPSCAYVLARLFVRVDNVVVRVRETRLLIDFFGITPKIYRDVTWRECYWEDMAANGLSTDVRSWTLKSNDPAAFHANLQKLPEIQLPSKIFKHAMLEPDKKPGASTSQLQTSPGKGVYDEL